MYSWKSYNPSSLPSPHTLTSLVDEIDRVVRGVLSKVIHPPLVLEIQRGLQLSLVPLNCAGVGEVYLRHVEQPAT